jgi:hypothetical protein
MFVNNQCSAVRLPFPAGEASTNQGAALGRRIAATSNCTLRRDATAFVRASPAMTLVMLGE